MYAAIAVTPMLSTTAIRTPARMTGNAIGISTRTSLCTADIPMPIAAERSAGSTLRIAV